MTEQYMHNIISLIHWHLISLFSDWWVILRIANPRSYLPNP
jgi:hypothetical protein